MMIRANTTLLLLRNSWNRAEAVILGCTEIAMLVESQHTDVKLYDTTEIHAKAAVEKALDSK